MSTNGYLDSSAVIALVLEDPGRSAPVREALARCDFVATSMVAYAECRAALAAAQRQQRVESREGAAARERLDSIWFELERVSVTEDCIRRAGSLSDTRGLRGFDALHLASALVLGDNTAFLTWDTRLADAARMEGLAAPV